MTPAPCDFYLAILQLWYLSADRMRRDPSMKNVEAYQDMLKIVAAHQRNCPVCLEHQEELAKLETEAWNAS